MLQAATEDALHLVLETLTAIINADPAAAAHGEAAVSPAVLSIWVANVSDPLLAGDTVELLEALAAIPDCLPSLQVRRLRGRDARGACMLMACIWSVIRQMAGRSESLHAF